MRSQNRWVQPRRPVAWLLTSLAPIFAISFTVRYIKAQRKLARTAQESDDSRQSAASPGTNSQEEHDPPPATPPPRPGSPDFGPLPDKYVIGKSGTGVKPPPR